MREPQEETQRRQAIAWAIALTADTHLAPEQYEMELLEEYTQGILTLSQVLTQLDSRVQHVLYRSRATELLTPAQLTDLMEESAMWNKEHDITGLLCYSDDGYFVQVLEGAASDVNALFARIRQDPRHYAVTPLSDKATKTRWFSGWQMAYIEMKSDEFFWLIDYLEARDHNLILPQIPIVDARLLSLLSEFSKT